MCQHLRQESPISRPAPLLTSGRRARSISRALWPRRLESDTDTTKVMDCFNQFKKSIVNTKPDVVRIKFNSMQRRARCYFSVTVAQSRLQNATRIIVKPQHALHAQALVETKHLILAEKLPKKGGYQSHLIHIFLCGTSSRLKTVLVQLTKKRRANLKTSSHCTTHDYAIINWHWRNSSENSSNIFTTFYRIQYMV